jgi:hypothetical protein
MNKLRWLRRAAGFSALAVSSGIVLGYGCESPTQFDDLCGWLHDSGNCYRDFFIDVGARCGAADDKPGQFLTRDNLSLCILDQGGQILIDPPIDLNNPPPSNTDPFTFTFVNADATKCGTLTFSAEYDFSITINGDPPPADGSDPPASAVAGGTFSMTGGKDTDILATSCPDGSTFTFDRLQVTRCDDVEQILPHVQLDFNPGGIEQAGVVRLYVYYPPQDGELANATPVPVNYFDCIIPPAPPPCQNGVKDGSETDIDCGGSFCSTKCQDGQSCINDGDCASNVCGLVMGIKQCIGP